MISVDGDHVILPISDKLLRKELAVLLAMVRIRAQAKGYASLMNYDIEQAMKEAETQPVDYLKSEAKMCAEEARSFL